MEKQPKTFDDVRYIVMQICIPDCSLRLLEKGDGYLVQVLYNEADIETGKVELQKSRKHYITQWMTETEIVDTVFYAAMRSAEHRVREHFTYKGRRVQSPHFDINWRLEGCDAERFDKRP